MLRKISLIIVSILLISILTHIVSAEPILTKQLRDDNEFITFSASQEKFSNEINLEVLLPKTPEEFAQKIEKNLNLNLSSDKKLQLTKDIENSIYGTSSKTEDLKAFAIEIETLTGIEIGDEDIQRVEDELKDLMMRPLVNDIVGERLDNTLTSKGINQESANAPYISPDETAPFLGGSTKVVIIFVNPDGEDWEDDYYDDLVYSWNEVKKATDWMKSRAPSGADLSFVQGYYVADTSCDIDNPSGCSWTEDAVKNLGFSDSDGDGSYTDDMLIFNKNYYGTDNAIAVFVPHIEGRAYAMVYGPPKTVVYFYDSCTTILWWPVCTKEEYPTYAHEMLHLFGAGDEYYQEWDGTGCGANSCWEPVEFSYEPLQDLYTNGNCERCNPNSVDCVMKSHWVIKSNPAAIEYYTKGQIGWWDYDADGEIDPYDNCISISNPSQSDSDGDGVGNACDNDGDNDGVTNNIDNCPSTYNPSQQNNDGDSYGDACDSDDDNDGVLDSNDNCPINYNPLQENNDGDSEGDICDIDDDNDGVRDTLDNCPLIPGLPYYNGCPDTDAPQASSSWISLGSSQPNGFVTINVYIYDPSGINYAIAKIKDSNGNIVNSINLYDDGSHGDGSLNDNLYGNTWFTSTQGNFFVDLKIEDAEYNFGEYTDILKFTTSTFVPNSKILLVYDDSTNYQNYFQDALINNNISFDYYNVYERGSPYSSLFDNYKLIIWATGNDYKTTLTIQDQANIANYLDNGGSLFITGQDIGYSLGSSNFYEDYLKADYIKDDTNLLKLKGNSWNPNTYDISLSLFEGDGANNQYYPSEIDPRGGSWAIFYYDETSGSSGGGGGVVAEPQKEPSFISTESEEGLIANSPTNSIESTGTAAIAFENDIYKLVYFAFGFESINNKEQRDKIMFEMVDFLFDLTPPEINVYRTDIYDYALWDDFWYNNDSMNLKITTDEIVEEMRVSIDRGTESTCFNCNEILDSMSSLSQGNHSIEVHARDYYGNIGNRLINFHIDTLMPALIFSAYNSELGTDSNLVGPNSPITISYSIDEENLGYNVFAIGDLIDIGNGEDKVEGLILVSQLPAKNSDSLTWNAKQYRLGGQEVGEVVVVYQSEGVYGVEGSLCVPIVSAAPNSEPLQANNVPAEFEKYLHVNSNEDCTWTMAQFNSSTLKLIGFDRELVYNSDTIFNYYTNNNTPMNLALGDNFRLVEENVANNKIYNIYVGTSDMAGNNNFSIVDILTDTQSPILKSTTPSNNESVSKFSLLFFNLTDNNPDWKNAEITATLNGESFTGFTWNVSLEEIINPPTISFSCSPNMVVQGETITCNCLATDEIDPNPKINFTVNPPTSEIGTFMTSCTATNEAGKSSTLSLSYNVISPDEEGPFPDGGGGGGGGSGAIPKVNGIILNITEPKNGIYTFTIRVEDLLNNVGEYKVSIKDLNVFEDITTNIQNLSFESNDIINETSKEIIFKKVNDSIISFKWDYNLGDIDFSEISIQKQKDGSLEGSLIISGIDLTSQNQTKTVFLDKISSSANRICIKDAEISSLAEISSGCNGENEISLVCPGSLGAYTCEIITNSYYKISGLSHSGIKEYTYTETPIQPPSGGGGGGGGGSTQPKKNVTISNQTNTTTILPTNISETSNKTSAEQGEGISENQKGFAGITGAVIGGVMNNKKITFTVIFVFLIVGASLGLWVWKKKNKYRV